MADKEYDSDDSEHEVENLKEEKAEEPQEDTSLNNPDVVTKYQEAAKIAQAVLLEVMSRVRGCVFVSTLFLIIVVVRLVNCRHKSC
jgi:hypothetical protein